jgi:regulator of replication initiation timing
MTDFVTEARKRYQQATDATKDNDALAIADTKFALGDSDNGWQYEDAVWESSRNSKKPTLTINVTAQHCNQIINNIRQNRPQVKVLPVDSNSDKKTAEIMAGLIRNIQSVSNSDDAHDLAAEHSIYGGDGYWRILTEFESPESFNQVIKIKPIPNPRLVKIDPSATALDKSDAMWGFVEEEISIEQCKREHPDIDPASWGDDTNAWHNKETIKRAEYFYCEYKDDTLCMIDDGTIALKSKVDNYAELKKSGAIIKERATSTKQWKWCKLLGGHDEPIQETEWLGDYLPIVAVIGKELNVDGEIVRKGLVRDLKDPARMLNYSYSGAVETIALQTKIPYIGSIEAFEGHEDQWKAANSTNYAYLPFNAYDSEGLKLDRPQRELPAVMPSAQIQMLQLSTEQIRAASGQQNSNFGIKSEASSGVGIQRLKAQGEMATFHFPDNLSRALRYEATILIDLIPKIMDVKQVVRILGMDGTHEQAVLDPKNPQAYAENEDAKGDIEKIFNPTLGKYDVAITTGASFQTQRQEGAAALSEMVRGNPDLLKVAGDLVFKAYDFPGADALADRMAKTLPPELQEKKGQQQVPPEMQQAMQQQGQQLEQIGAALEDSMNQIEALKTENESLKIDKEIKLREITLKEDVAFANANKAEPDPNGVDQTQVAVATINAESAERIAVINARASQPEAEEKESAEPQFNEETGEEIVKVDPIQQVLGALVESNQQMMQVIATSLQPKTASIRIEKQPDGSFVGQKIEE